MDAKPPMTKIHVAVPFILSFFLCSIFDYFIIHYHHTRFIENIIYLIEQKGFLLPSLEAIAAISGPCAVFWGNLFLTVTFGTSIACLVTLIWFAFSFRQTLFSGQSIAIVLATALIGLSQVYWSADASFFIRVRDQILFRCDIGNFLSQIYYRYSPVAAQVLSPLTDRQIKFFYINPSSDATAIIKPMLISRSWYPVDNPDTADISIFDAQKNYLDFKTGDKRGGHVPVKDFINSPDRYLLKFSNQTDSLKAVRYLCWAGLIFFLPVLTLVLVFMGIKRLLNRFIPANPALILSGIFINVIIAMLLATLYPPLNKLPDNIALSDMDPAWPNDKKVEALRAVSQGKRAANRTPYWDQAMSSPDTAQRYWFALALTSGEFNLVFPYLEHLSRDSNINVACAAIKSLSAFPCTPSLNALFTHLLNTDRAYYFQLYVMRALHRCQ